MEAERDSTQQCLKICAEVFDYIENKARAVLPTAMSLPSSLPAAAQLPVLITAEAFNLAQRNFISSTLQLQQYFHSINSQAQAARHHVRAPTIEHITGQQSLEDEAESISDSLSLCDRAADQESEIRRNFYEDISVGDDSQQVILSLKDLISAKRVTAGSRSTQLMGQFQGGSLEEIARGHYHSGRTDGQ